MVALEQQVGERERELTATKHDLQRVQDEYLHAVGDRYRTLNDIESRTLAAEVAAGLREPEADADGETAGADDDTTNDEASSGAECDQAVGARRDLKSMFRTLAKTIHPDLALDGPARWRRHSLMAEANRAYAERDEDRLRLILELWQREPDADLEDHTLTETQRLERRAARAEARMLQLDAEFADLRGSAIWRLREKIEDARAKGWDLLAEMVQEIAREIQRANARLVTAETLARSVGPRQVRDTSKR